MALIGSQAAVGKSYLTGKAYVLFPQSFVPEYQQGEVDTHLGCGTAVSCKSSIYNFCVGMREHKGAFVPAVTICQNLWILESPDTV